MPRASQVSSSDGCSDRGEAGTAGDTGSEVNVELAAVELRTVSHERLCEHAP